MDVNVFTLNNSKENIFKDAKKVLINSRSEGKIAILAGHEKTKGTIKKNSTLEVYLENNKIEEYKNISGYYIIENKITNIFID